MSPSTSASSIFIHLHPSSLLDLLRSAGRPCHLADRAVIALATVRTNVPTFGIAVLLLHVVRAQIGVANRINLGG